MYISRIRSSGLLHFRINYEFI